MESLFGAPLPAGWRSSLPCEAPDIAPEVAPRPQIARLTLPSVGGGLFLPVRNAGLDNKKDTNVAEKSQNVQDVFLNHVRRAKTPVTVFLVNGVKLQGIITWFDNFSVLLRRDGHTQLVYKHAISTVMPGSPIQLFDATKAEGGQVAETEAAAGAA